MKKKKKTKTAVQNKQQKVNAQNQMPIGIMREREREPITFKTKDNRKNYDLGTNKISNMQQVWCRTQNTKIKNFP